MSVPVPDLRLPARGDLWKWWICGLLLLATMINYMDRLTLNLTIVRVMDDLCLDPSDYGTLEAVFGLAFAMGALVIGWSVDRWNVRWVYPAGVLAWSAAGYLSGMAGGFTSLLLCRIGLGLAEGSNWPCALRTTQRILPPAQRSQGNGILQSGAAIGAIITPLVVLVLVPWTDTWRYPFFVLGALGVPWVLLWVQSTRKEDLALPKDRARAPREGTKGTKETKGTERGVGGEGVSAQPQAAPASEPISTWAGLLQIWGDRRFWVLVVLVVSINIAWHYFRAWLPLFLQKHHHYSETATSLFFAGYYSFTFLGSVTAGFVTLFLTRCGLPVHWSRVLVFFTCALLTTLSVVAAVLPAGWLLIGVLLVIGFAALGLYPNYYSFSQDLTVQHQGKLTGMLSCINWLAMAGLHIVAGKSVEYVGYSWGVALAGLAPLVGLLALLLLWGRPQPVRREVQVVEAQPVAPSEQIKAAR